MWLMYVVSALLLSSVGLTPLLLPELKNVFLFGFLKWAAIIVSLLTTVLLGFLYGFFWRKKSEFKRIGVFLSGDGEALNAESVMNESKFVLAGLAASLVLIAINIFAFF
ncbi:MAG: hypothetical protein C9356_20360 [Oleiphilus sp.]|nr:MAG: hypothetical protein C9356_20360 [Oleiphilus sp.]